MTEQNYFDARIEDIDPGTNIIRFAINGHMLEVQDSKLSDYWRVGTYGRLCLRDDTSNSLTFYVYPDQRLRRKPECDIVDTRLWCWTIEGVDDDILVL